MGLPGGSIKGDENICKQTLNAILSFVSPKMKDIPIDKQVCFQTLQEQKLPDIHNGEIQRHHQKSHENINFADLSQSISRSWRNLPTDKVNFYRNLAMLDMKRFKTALET